MDVRQASYMRGTMNWQMAFIVIEEIGTNVQVSIINLEKDGTFIVSGKRYGRSR
jgi:hypothetical protein